MYLGVVEDGGHDETILVGLAAAYRPLVRPLHDLVVNPFMTSRAKTPTPMNTTMAVWGAARKKTDLMAARQRVQNAYSDQ